MNSYPQISPLGLIIPVMTHNSSQKTYIAVVSIVSICLLCDSCIVATCSSIPAARFAFRLCFIRFVLLFEVVLSGEPKQNQGRGSVDRKLVQAPPPSPPPPPPPPPVISLLAVPRRFFCFGSLVILDVMCCYLWLFSLYINIKICKNSCYILD